MFLPGEPRDGGAWWAAVYGVAQSRTRLRQLSSSSSSSSRGFPGCPGPQFCPLETKVMCASSDAAVSGRVSAIILKDFFLEALLTGPFFPPEVPPSATGAAHATGSLLLLGCPLLATIFPFIHWILFRGTHQLSSAVLLIISPPHPPLEIIFLRHKFYIILSILLKSVFQRILTDVCTHEPTATIQM